VSPTVTLAITTLVAAAAVTVIVVAFTATKLVAALRSTVVCPGWRFGVPRRDSCDRVPPSSGREHLE
jgi:hypothetical protein